jgi:hypothetical protein
MSIGNIAARRFDYETITANTLAADRTKFVRAKPAPAPIHDGPKIDAGYLAGADRRIDDARVGGGSLSFAGYHAQRDQRLAAIQSGPPVTGDQIVNVKVLTSKYTLQGAERVKWQNEMDQVNGLVSTYSPSFARSALVSRPDVQATLARFIDLKA